MGDLDRKLKENSTKDRCGQISVIFFSHKGKWDNPHLCLSCTLL